ncbi:TetR family transcriptional regulator [Salimicrobium halophilum]|uniref:Uncharacterized protein n=1 Tax=Salimicrobium halophilum TaxID=86666 RepID=A0A1G8WJT8_9BACI|nr:TetR family transcriptional regulator [Salimicrobium halophilum]SDJ77820.1 hypothetical protein SAMN04490247_3192 [Salimicrobium halophilum]
MAFYKILYQPNDKNPPFYKQVSLKKIIVGENSYSFAVPYSPQSFSTWLMNDEIYRIILDSTVKQLIMSNHKFLDLILNQDYFDLDLVDCDFENVNVDNLLEGEEFSAEMIITLLQDEDYQMVKLYFRTKSHHMITLKSNGVLGIDTELREEEIVNIKKLISFVSFGPVMLV